MSETGRVVEFHPTKRDAPALGMSVVMNMPGDRQATLQCFIASDASLSEQNALMDQMFAIGDRQKARYEIVGLKAELVKHRKMLDRMAEDIPNGELDHQRKQDELRAEIRKCNEMSEDAIKASYNNWAARGKRGAHKPEGSTKSLIEGMERQIKQHQAKMEANDAEKAKYLVQIEATMARHRQEMAEIEADIAHRESLLG